MSWQGFSRPYLTRSIANLDQRTKAAQDIAAMADVDMTDAPAPAVEKDKTRTTKAGPSNDSADTKKPKFEVKKASCSGDCMQNPHSAD